VMTTGRLLFEQRQLLWIQQLNVLVKALLWPESAIIGPSARRYRELDVLLPIRVISD